MVSPPAIDTAYAPAPAMTASASGESGYRPASQSEPVVQSALVPVDYVKFRIMHFLNRAAADWLTQLAAYRFVDKAFKKSSLRQFVTFHSGISDACESHCIRSSVTHPASDMRPAYDQGDGNFAAGLE
jgi:hypothetical protein